jgi:hypothetical protein
LVKLKKNEDSRLGGKKKVFFFLFWENSMRGLVVVWQVDLVRGKELQGNICDMTILGARWVSYGFLGESWERLGGETIPFPRGLVEMVVWRVEDCGWISKRPATPVPIYLPTMIKCRKAKKNNK